MKKKDLETLSAERQRKEWKRGAGTTQKMVSFRADTEVLEILERQPNKGRFLNQLVTDWAKDQGDLK